MRLPGPGDTEASQAIQRTINRPTRREALTRLLKLNHQRYAEEVARGLHDKLKLKAKKKSAWTDAGRTLFGEE